MSGISILLSSEGGFAGGVRYQARTGYFFKVATLPSSSMILCDLDLGVTGYYRTILTSAGHVILEASFGGGTGSVDLTPTVPCVNAAWYWVGTTMGRHDDFSGTYILDGQVWDDHSVSSNGQQGTQVGCAAQFGSYNALLGWGVSRSAGGTYGNFPNASGNVLSKLVIYSNAVSVNEISYPSPPTSDLSPTSYSGTDALYLCRDAVGTTTGTLDSTSNHYNLTPGPQGLLVVPDGPYA